MLALEPSTTVEGTGAKAARGGGRAEGSGMCFRKTGDSASLKNPMS